MPLPGQPYDKMNNNDLINLRGRERDGGGTKGQPDRYQEYETEIGENVRVYGQSWS